MIKELPPEPSNPYKGSQQPVCAHLTRTAGFQPISVTAVSEYPVSCSSLHPNKALLVSGSDDHVWRLWTVPRYIILMHCIAVCVIRLSVCVSMELIASGEGHTDWLSSVQYSPNGLTLATSSGDGTVKLWTSTSCLATLSEHQQPGRTNIVAFIVIECH